MGKLDELRALREARFATSHAPAVDRTVAAKQALAKALTPPAPVDVVCGHRAIGGKSCIRAKDHSEKTHRYPKN